MREDRALVEKVHIRRWLLAVVMFFMGITGVHAQAVDSTEVVIDSTDVVIDSTMTVINDSVSRLSADSATLVKPKRDWNTWKPKPQRALWLALVLPGAGQIYNRKYWKLPIFYGGFMGCVYALSWNNTMYKDYSQAYLDIMDSDPGTASYNKFLHLGVEINDSNIERYKSLFKSRRDKYRRWRDMSIIAMIAVYAISVVDAYIDAELSEFDISNDLSLHVSPAVIPNGAAGNRLEAQSLGLSCSLNF